MNLPETPISRVEQYLSNIAGEETQLHEKPLSRVEQYLAYIAEHGGGGADPHWDAVQDKPFNTIGDGLSVSEDMALNVEDAVKYVAQTLTDAQKAQARENINAAAPDGYYGNSGGVYQYSTNFLGKNTPQNASNIVFRPTASNFSGSGWSADSISGQTATIEKIKGKTLVFNQLFRQGSSHTELGITYTFSNGILHINGTSTLSYSDFGTKCDSLGIKENGHKYLFIAKCLKNTDSVSFRTGFLNGRILFSDGSTNVLIHESGQIKSNIGTCDTSKGQGLGISGFSIGTVFNDVQLQIMVIDLTKMYGSTVANSMTVDEFKAQFPLDYYVYNEGELISFNGTGLKTTGFNQLYADGHIDVLAGLTYKIEGTYTSLKDSAGNDVTVTNGEFTPTANDTYTMVGGTCVHLKWSGVRDGETEPHWDSTLSLPIATYFEDGMKSAGTVYDELTKDKAIKRIGSRAYQEGDEDDATVVTDGTTTLYALETPVITPISPELNLIYKVDDFGTEMLLPQNTDEPVTAPMDADIVYQLDYEADVRNMGQNMISKESMDGFITAFNGSGLGTITQTWDAVNKKYTYTVTPPQHTEGGETV